MKSEFTKEDLYWLIAISSVANKQDLNQMSVESIQTLSISHLSENTSLFSDDYGKTTT